MKGVNNEDKIGKTSGEINVKNQKHQVIIWQNILSHFLSVSTFLNCSSGLPKFASIESLYFETGKEPFHSRRHSRILNIFYTIRNNDSGLYLYDCLVPFIREENDLNLCTQNRI